MTRRIKHSTTASATPSIPYTAWNDWLVDETGAVIDIDRPPAFDGFTGVLVLGSGGPNLLHTGAFEGWYNTLIGIDAGVAMTKGYNNVALGWNALNATTIGDGNTAIGGGALALNTAGRINVAVGNGALGLNTTGYGNGALGALALVFNKTGYRNVAVGDTALYMNSTGHQNVAIGDSAMHEMTTGYKNVAVGQYALYYLRPTSKAITAFADYSGMVPGTVKATSVGHGLPGGPTTNIAISGTANYNGTYTVTQIDVDNFYFTDAWVATETGWWGKDLEGRQNTAVGRDAGNGITLGDSNTFLGYEAGHNALQPPTVVNSMALGNGAYTTKDNQVVIGNAAIVETILRGQIGIGASPAVSAALDIPSTTGALLVPRMTTGEKNALTGVNGMIVYDATLGKFQGYEAGAWASLI